MKKNIVHLVTPYLFHTGSWIYTQVQGITQYNSVVFTQKIENLDIFPFNNIISIEQKPALKKFINKIYRRATKNYGLFFEEDIKKWDPLLIHGHFGQESWFWLHHIKKWKRPLITTFYGLDVSQLGQIREWRNRFNDLFKHGALFLAEGTNLKKQLMRLGCPEEKIIIQHLGVNIDNYPIKADYAAKSPAIQILQVASFREKKGIRYSLESIHLLKKKGIDCVFTLVGGGDETALHKINYFIEKFDIEKNVRVIGSLPHAKIIELIAHSDIFLHPSVTAADGDNEGGSPVVVTEASAIGIPVVGSFHADLPEVVLHNKSGLLAPEKDSATLAENLALLASDALLREQFGKAGREHIIKNYNLPVQIQALERIYQRFEKA